jgi:hypothetical protein
VGQEQEEDYVTDGKVPDPPPPKAVLAAAVYADASSLRRLPADLSHPDLARLNDLVERFGIEKYVPAIVRDEWVAGHQLIARRKRQEMIGAARAVDKYLGPGTVRAEPPTDDALEREVERVQLGRLAAGGFVEIPTPDTDLRELLRHAVRWTKPFAENDKGFRDAMIVRTIAAHSAQFIGAEILIISYDDVFHHPDVLAQFGAVGIAPTVVRDFKAAAACLEAGLDEAGREAMEAEAEEVAAFLRTRREEIFTRVLKEAEVTEQFIRGGLLQKQAYYGTLERIRAVRPVDIGKVSFGHVLGRHVQRDGRRRPVTFFVKVMFDIIVREFSLSSLSLFGGGGPRIRLDVVDHPVPAQGLFDQTPAQTVTDDIQVEREIIVEAWVIEDEKTGLLVDLEIEKISAW